MTKIKKSEIMILALLLMVSQAYAIEINDTCLRRINGTVNYNIFGSGDYYPYLVEGRQGIVNLSIRTLGNWSYDHPDIHIRLQSEVFCYETKRNNGTRCGISLSWNSYKDIQGNNYTVFEGNCDFSIPLGSKYCSIDIEIYGINSSIEGNYRACKLPDSFDFPRIKGNVITEGEYLTKRTIEISREQTNISKQQAENSQRQTEIIDRQRNISEQNLKLIENSQFFGIDKGTIVGAIIALAGSFFGGWYITKKEIERQRMKRVAENICQLLHTTLDYNVNILKKPSGILSNNHWKNIKNIYEFNFVPDKLQNGLIDYFDNKITKQMKRQEEIGEDVEGLLWEIFIKDLGEKGLSTNDRKCPSLSRTGRCGSVQGYSNEICKAILDGKKIDEDFVKKKFSGLGYYRKKDIILSNNEEIEIANTYRSIWDSMLKIPNNLTNELKKELEEYRQNNKTILEESKRLDEKLKEIMQKYGH